MAYVALMEIGDYKKGMVVPDELAELWLSMYKSPPVGKVALPAVGEPVVKDVPKPVVQKKVDDAPVVERKSVFGKKKIKR